LLIIAIIYVLSTIVILPVFVEYFFDKKWMGSVDISINLLPLIFSLIAIAPLTNLFQFTGNQKEIFRLHFISLLIAIVSFYIAILKTDFLLGVIIFSILTLFRYIYIAFKLTSVKNFYNV
jgi:O-antigen/teichoic acid export membrane protein